MDSQKFPILSKVLSRKRKAAISSADVESVRDTLSQVRLAKKKLDRAISNLDPHIKIPPKVLLMPNELEVFAHECEALLRELDNLHAEAEAEALQPQPKPEVPVE